jgi:hypothetical protein
MTKREQIEAQIRMVLATETRAIEVSEALFRRGGLFSQLANSRAERETLVQTALFQEAQRRLSDLQENEMATWQPSSSAQELRPSAPASASPNAK